MNCYRSCYLNEQQIDEEFRMKWERIQNNRCCCVNQSQEDMRWRFVENGRLSQTLSDCVNRIRGVFEQPAEPIKVKAEVVREKPLALPEE